jgi:hypothetical protein
MYIIIEYVLILIKTFHPKKKNRFPRMAVSVIVVSGMFVAATV